MLRKLAALDARRRALLAYGAGLVLISKAALFLPGGSLPQRQWWLDGRGAPARAAPVHTERGRLGDHGRGAPDPGTRCSAWALALRALFTQAGVASELRIGVAADGPARSGLTPGLTPPDRPGAGATPTATTCSGRAWRGTVSGIIAPAPR